MNPVMEDLGPVAYGDLCMYARYAREPRTGQELALVSLSRSGFLVIDPRARTGYQVTVPKPFTEWWTVRQAPDGSVYQLEYNAGTGPTCLVRWNWEGTASDIVAHVPGKAFFMIDAAPDGRIFMPACTRNVMLSYDPGTGSVSEHGSFAAFGKTLHDVACGQDGLVYATTPSYPETHVVVLDPATNEKRLLDDAGLLPDGVHARGFTKDSNGRVLVPTTRWGRPYWYEAVDGRLHDVDQKELVIASGEGKCVAFTDGGYIDSIEEPRQPRESGPATEAIVTYVSPEGGRTTFPVAYEGVPLRIFSVAGGLDKVWAGTFIPLTLASYDPSDGRRVYYANPTGTNGEIYSMSASNGKLYMGSYTRALVTRYAPDEPWRPDVPVNANPVDIGMIKDDAGGPLQRPYGVAKDVAGNVFFAAMGGYGVDASGLTRIDPATDEMTHWVFPETTFTVMEYLDTTHQLLIAENRKGDGNVRATLVDPETGAIAASDVLFDGEGQVTDWLFDGNDTVYGLHNSTATVFAYSVSERRITASLPELGMGHHCYDTFLFGPDDRIWGLTRECVYAVDRELTAVEVIARYDDHADGNFYRFGMHYGPDGNIYFPNGPHLMRLTVV